MTRDILVLNGPNLARLGAREPEVYGATTAAELAQRVQGWATELGLSADVRFTDDEAELVGWLHEAGDRGAPVVLNAAALTHYSYALHDAVRDAVGRGSAVVEVHLSNPAARDTFRQTSVIAGVCTGSIAGFGPDSYRLALVALSALVDDRHARLSDSSTAVTSRGPDRRSRG